MRMNAWYHGYEAGRLGREYDPLGYRSGKSITRYGTGYREGIRTVWRDALREAKLFYA